MQVKIVFHIENAITKEALSEVSQIKIDLADDGAGDCILVIDDFRVGDKRATARIDFGAHAKIASVFQKKQEMQVKLIGGPMSEKVVIVGVMDDHVMVPMVGPNGMEFNFYKRQPEGFVFSHSAPDATVP